MLVDIEVMKRVFVAFCPTAILGILFYKIIKHFLMGSDQVILWSMFVGGICLIVFELLHKEKDDAIEDLGRDLL